MFLKQRNKNGGSDYPSHQFAVDDQQAVALGEWQRQRVRPDSTSASGVSQCAKAQTQQPQQAVRAVNSEPDEGNIPKRKLIKP